MSKKSRPLASSGGSSKWQRLYEDAKKGRLTKAWDQGREAKTIARGPDERTVQSGTYYSSRVGVLLHGGNTEERRLREENDRLKLALEFLQRREAPRPAVRPSMAEMIDDEIEPIDHDFEGAYQRAQTGASQPRRFRDDGDSWGDSPEPSPRVHEIAPARPAVYRRIRAEE